MNATEQYFPVVLFIMLYKVVSLFLLGPAAGRDHRKSLDENIIQVRSSIYSCRCNFFQFRANEILVNNSAATLGMDLIRFNLFRPRSNAVLHMSRTQLQFGSTQII